MSLSKEVNNLRDFLDRRYPHRMSVDGLSTDEAVIQMTIALLTPGDGSDAAWERMYTACGARGIEAQRMLVVQTAAMFTEASAAQTSDEQT